MPAAPVPPDESVRLRALYALRVLDTPAERAFDDLARQARELCATPVALVNLVDKERQWSKSRVGGAGPREVPREQSLCAHALLTPERPLIIPDAAADPRFADNSHVTEDGVRFYAGIPLRSPEGHALGALCVIDHVPRQLSLAQIDGLKAIAQKVSIRMGLRQRAPAERGLAGGFALGFALLLALALLCAEAANRFLSSDQWVAHTHQVISEVERTIFEVQAAESSMRGFSASGLEIYLPPYRAALDSLPGHLAILRKSINDDPAQLHRYDFLQTKIDAKLAVMRERYEQRRTLGALALDPRYLDGRGRWSMEAITAIGHEMINAENDLLRDHTARRADGLHIAVVTVVASSGVAAALLGLGFALTRRALRRSHALGGALAHINTSLEGEVAERRRVQGRLSVQHAVARAAAEHVSLPDAAPHFLRAICEHLDWSLGELWTPDPAAGVMRCTERWHAHGGSAMGSPRVAGFVEAGRSWTFARGEGLPGRAWRDGVPTWEYPLADSVAILRLSEIEAGGLRRAFAFPLHDGKEGEVQSVMVFLSREQGAPDADLIATMDTLANQISQFTERCRAETDLRASQERFTAFIEDAPAIAYIKDEEGHFLYGNQTLLHRFGLRREEWLGRTDADFWPDAAPALRAHDRQVLAGETSVELKESVPLLDGSASHWLSYKFPLRDEATGRKLLAGMSIDITEREHAEAALHAEREFLAALLDNLQAGVIACDARGRLTHCNRAAAALHGLPVEGASPSAGQWVDFFDLLPENGGAPRHAETSPLARALRGETLRDQEFVVRPPDEPERALSLNVAPFEDGVGRRLGAVAVIHDVTVRRRAREAALRSLHEKETLLQEVHHRVKNNLQIIGSLLSMQARRTRSPAALAALAESASRVKSIALVHEKLYRSADLTCVEAADYLRTLSRNLMDALGAERLRLGGRVALDFELEDGHQLDASVAIACGLIVNEALTNSFKHGFPGERSGHVTVALARLPVGLTPSCAEAPAATALDRRDRPDDRWLRLEVRDDGVGLSAEALTPTGTAEMARQSLGMRLVRDLSKQIGGRFEFSPTDPSLEAGLTLRVEFPLPALAA